MSGHTNLPDILVSHRDICFVQADFLCCEDTVFHGLGLGFPVLLPSSLAASSGMAGGSAYEAAKKSSLPPMTERQVYARWRVMIPSAGVRRKSSRCTRALIFGLCAETCRALHVWRGRGRLMT
jgi:hypothetical protein